MKFRTRAIHVGNETDPATGAVIPPIHLATTFVQPGAGEWRQFDYARSGSPTRNHVERTLASLEGGCGALAFSTGMAATHAVTMLLKTGDHVLAGADLYGGTYRLLHRICDRSGIEVTLGPLDDPLTLESMIQPNTRLIWIESVGNPLMTIPDIETIAAISKRHGILLGVDNTFPSPVLVRPLQLGADISMHSGTKYLGGHSDCLAGVLVVHDKPLFDQLYFVQNATGAVLGPFESFLMARGIKTLELRMREQSRSAMQIATWLEQRPEVKRVLYPGLSTHPQHALAGRQMHGAFGAMLTFEVNGDLEATRKVCQSTRLFGLAVSLGAVESLIEQPATMSHASYAAADRKRFGIGDGLIRLSVGLEDPDDLIEDLEFAFRSAFSDR